MKIVSLPDNLVASGLYDEFAQGPGKRQGRSNSLKWPWLYDKLVAKGYDHSKAAAISNSRIGMRKNGRISVLKASEAHNPKVLKRIAAADKKGKHATRKQLTSSAVWEFACHTKACAPPPVGSGGSRRGGRIIRALRQPIYPPGTEWLVPTTFKVITKAEARGDSRSVSHAEFQRLAAEGQKQLDQFAADKSPITGLNRHWEALKTQTHAEVQNSWGGATIDSHTGRALPQGADKYAITVKGKGHSTISVSETASFAEFSSAMDRAKKTFGSILERQSHYLGVFHDDENHRIDIDPVIVVSKRSDVDTIGAASRSIGGAYNFKDGNGYWPPHVAEG